MLKAINDPFIADVQGSVILSGAENSTDCSIHVNVGTVATRSCSVSNVEGNV